MPKYPLLLRATRSWPAGHPVCTGLFLCLLWLITNNCGFSPQANYTDRATAACQRSWCQLLRIKGATWSGRRIPYGSNLGFLDRLWLIRGTKRCLLSVRKYLPRCPKLQVGKVPVHWLLLRAISDNCTHAGITV
jgi:hypothetical protein